MIQRLWFHRLCLLKKSIHQVNWAVLFTEYLLPFEAISLLLLVAVIGAVVIASAVIPDHPHDANSTGSHSVLSSLLFAGVLGVQAGVW